MFYVHEVRNLLSASNFRTPARPAGFENFGLWSIGRSGGLLRHVRSTPALNSGHSPVRSKCSLSAHERRSQLFDPSATRTNIVDNISNARIGSEERKVLLTQYLATAGPPK